MFSNSRYVAMAALLFLTSCGGANSESPKTEAGAEPAAETTAETDKADFEVAANDMVMGDADAPVTIIEYASVTCPGCAAFHTSILPAVKEKYIDTGKAKLVFREFPTPPVEFSYIGSVLARCAADKTGTDTYFVVIDALLKNQRTWIYGEDPKLELLKIAAQVGMDEPEFDACLKRQEIVDAMNERIETGRTKYNISSTPSFVIDGEPTRIGSKDDFFAAMDKALGEETKTEAETEPETEEDTE